MSITIVFVNLINLAILAKGQASGILSYQQWHPVLS
jgi:hypothetical protein